VALSQLLEGQSADALGFEPGIVPAWIKVDLPGSMTGPIRSGQDELVELGVLVDHVADIGFRNVLTGAKRDHKIRVPASLLAASETGAAEPPAHQGGQAFGIAPAPQTNGTPPIAASFLNTLANAAPSPPQPPAGPSLHVQPGNPFPPVPDSPLARVEQSAGTPQPAPAGGLFTSHPAFGGAQPAAAQRPDKEVGDAAPVPVFAMSAQPKVEDNSKPPLTTEKAGEHAAPTTGAGPILPRRGALQMIAGAPNLAPFNPPPDPFAPVKDEATKPATPPAKAGAAPPPGTPESGLSSFDLLGEADPSSPSLEFPSFTPPPPPAAAIPPAIRRQVAAKLDEKTAPSEIDSVEDESTAIPVTPFIEPASRRLAPAQSGRPSPAVLALSASPHSSEQQILLRALLDSDDSLDLPRVIQLVSTLPGIAAAALINEGKVIGSSSSKAADARSFREQAPGVAASLRTLAPLIGIGESETFTLNTDSRLITLCLPGGECALAVLHDREPTQGLRDKLTLIARQLMAMAVAD
jgi:predicted regulator of Ras-like GTPase activity (Roadblock/LC7/MglB family)